MEKHDKKEPLLVVKNMVFNHALFLRECLDGFIMQKTNFKFVVIVHDDASTDGSADIIREYAEKYPEIIKPYIESENLYSKGNGILGERIRDAVRIEAPNAKYIAMCEGDDYWTDPFKLQKQVDFLESHHEYVMCTHGYGEYIQKNNKFVRIMHIQDRSYDLNYYINANEWIFLTLTLVYRKEALNIDQYNKYPDKRDTSMIYHLLTQGKGYYMNEEMGIYRRHEGGIWTSVTNSGENKAWDIDVGVKMGIYAVEQTPEAILFLINSFNKRALSRKHLLKNYKTLWYIYKEYSKHFGIENTLKSFFYRMIRNKLS